MTRLAVVCLAILAASGCRRPRRSRAADVQPAAPAPTAPVGPKPAHCPTGAVMTASGCVRGTHTGTVTTYRGIPYAAPPIGALRWKPPAPPAEWPGVRDATAFGPGCPQLETALLNNPIAWNEDCLTLNVWSPDHAAKLPVMVWIHGGGLVQGASSLAFYDGTHLATDGNVVVVSINYRLGPLGFLAHPALTAEDTVHHASGNYGLHDQLAALAWVKQNVAAFGGDPTTVTIFGESAGGESVCALLASPLATGLFARAVIESAQCVGYGKTLRALAQPVGRAEAGEEQGLRIAKALGCDDLACLRAKSPEAILAASPAAVGFLGDGEHYGMTVDGWVLPDAPRVRLAAGTLANVPLLVGTTTDEATLFTSKIDLRRELGYRFVVKKLFPTGADRVLAQYPVASYGSPKQAFDALVTDLVFACPARAVARSLRAHQPHVYRYVFSHVTASAAQQDLGATHGTEIPYVFGTLSTPTPDERALSSAMLGAWARFARTGDPGGGWPAYDTTRDDYLELKTPAPAPGAGWHTAMCDVLDGLDD